MTRREISAEFCGARLRIARLLAGFTQVELAKLVSASSAFLSYVEAGQKQPGIDLVAGLAQVLGVTPDYFFRPPPQELLDEACFFRRRAATSVAVRQQVRAYATFFAELVGQLEEEFDFPPQYLPALRLARPEDMERLAERVRLETGLGRDLPIKNMMRVVENAGVPVTRFEGLSEKVDAFSWYGPRSLIVLNDRTPSRTRWDLAHELGHLLLHSRVEHQPEDLEREADRFASAFLLPRGSFIREFPRPRAHLDWNRVFRLKERWGVSLAAIVRRAYDLSLIDANQYRSTYKYMSWKGWLKGEPYEGASEEPEMIPTALAELKAASGMTYADLAEALGWQPSTLRKVTGGAARDPEPAPQRGGSKLVRFGGGIRRAS